MVTVSTNVGVGTVSTVLHQQQRLVPRACPSHVEYLMSISGVIGILYQGNASISGAEIGCQGEVGVACSMAAGALCAVPGGTPEQGQNAAEISMEYHL